MSQSTITDESLGHLPPPVARSVRRSGVVGQPIPHRVTLRQRGEILLRDRWFPFTGDERYTLDPPSFQWTGTVKLAGVPLARAEDSFENGHGRMHVRMLRLFTVIDETGPEMDQGALMRWLNDTMWFPHVWATDVISWKPIDEFTAVGAITVGDLEVAAEFRYDGDGRLVDFRADRYRVDDSGPELAGWRTPLTGYARFGGVEVPSRGAAVWELRGGDLEYIRLEITRIRYT